MRKICAKSMFEGSRNERKEKASVKDSRVRSIPLLLPTHDKTLCQTITLDLLDLFSNNVGIRQQRTCTFLLSHDRVILWPCMLAPNPNISRLPTRQPVPKVYKPTHPPLSFLLQLPLPIWLRSKCSICSFPVLISGIYPTRIKKID